MAYFLSTATTGKLDRVNAQLDGSDTLEKNMASIDGGMNLDMLAADDIQKEEIFRGVKRIQASKRILDILFSLSLLIATAPLLAIVSILIKLDSKGPVFYRQKRVGAGGKTFDIIKFRSMTVDAEREGASWADKNDPRVTRVGRYLRHFRIDEFPQAINVLKGEMSFVGPRPERPEFVEILNREIASYDLRHEVKPGITGWAQVKHEYGASVEDAREKLRFDLFYIKNYSPILDVLIVIMSVRVALFGIGSR